MSKGAVIIRRLNQIWNVSTLLQACHSVIVSYLRYVVIICGMGNGTEDLLLL